MVKRDSKIRLARGDVEFGWAIHSYEGTCRDRKMIQFLIDIPGDGVRARAIVRDVTPGKGMGVGIVAMSQEDRARYFTFLNKLQSS